MVLRQRGCDVRIITPGDGVGEFPGTVYDVGEQVVIWHRQGWLADVFAELHTNDGARGVFAIYPDWGTDVDVDVRDRLGPDLARRVSRVTGLPIWGNGTMSERKTAVGSQGFRLGIFRATAAIKATCTRLILECGAHTQPADLAILQTPGMLDVASATIGDALVEWANQWKGG